MEEIIFSITKEELQKFLEVTKELIKIHEDFKILFLEKAILIYTILGEDNGKINALKLFHFNLGEIFTEFPKKKPLNITFMEGKKFYDKMTFLLDTKEEDIKISIHHNKDYYAYSFSGKNDLLEIRTSCQTNNKIKDLSFEIIKDKLNSDYSDWKFDMTNEQLTKVLKLSKLENPNDSLSIKLENGDIIFSDTQWELKIGKSDYEKNGVWNIKKEYFKYILNEPGKDFFTISIFPSYVVVDETKSYLLFSIDLKD